MSTFVSNIDSSVKLPFDPAIHVHCPPMTPEQLEIFEKFKAYIKSKNLDISKHSKWADDQQLQRFLIARNYNYVESYKIFEEAVQWRNKRKPDLINPLHDEKWNKILHTEGETGKIFCPGYDKYGRTIVVFHNDVQNTKGAENQMNFLTFKLEYACKMMLKDKCDKYLIFMNLNNFSIFSAPSLSQTKETILMLTKCYPERLGHCICYQPPGYFTVLYNSLKGFLDPKTASKIHFISGDVKDGSKNDIKLKKIIGNDWKKLCGIEQPVIKPKTTLGFNHEVYWNGVLDNLRKLEENEEDFNEYKENKFYDQFENVYNKPVTANDTEVETEDVDINDTHQPEVTEVLNIEEQELAEQNKLEVEEAQ